MDELHYFVCVEAEHCNMLEDNSKVPCSNQRELELDSVGLRVLQDSHARLLALVQSVFKCVNGW